CSTPTVVGPTPAPHRRGLRIGAQDVDGMAKVSGWVGAEFAAYLRTILEVWARPGINNPDDAAPQHNPVPNPLDDESTEAQSGADPEFDVEVEPEPEAQSAEAESEVEPEPEAEAPGPAAPPVTCESPWIRWRLELLDSDQGLVVP
ncbi:MAG: DUF222 domain-containing protein, partial [Mycobacterium sp.]|nr:DUF222 domain-containing protein [Mycobacterium sp.]